MFKIVIALLAGLISASSWAATYVYSGGNYTLLIGTTYDASMRITGSFSTANPLPANMPTTNIGPSGSNLVQTWNFNDGVNTYTPANSYIPSGPNVATDAGGNIATYAMNFFSPLPPHVIGTPMKSVTVNTSLSQATTGAPCTLLAVNTCTLVDPFAATGGFATSTVGGTFILLATSIPIPALTAWNLLLLGGLLVLLAAAVARSARPFVDGENT